MDEGDEGGRENRIDLSGDDSDVRRAGGMFDQKTKSLVNGLLVDDKRQNRTPESFLREKGENKLFCYTNFD